MSKVGIVLQLSFHQIPLEVEYLFKGNYKRKRCVLTGGNKMGLKPTPGKRKINLGSSLKLSQGHILLNFIL